MGRIDITNDEREALHCFLRTEISLDQLLVDLHNMSEIEFLPTQRTFTSHFNLVEPPIRVAKVDVARALAKRRSGTMTERELVRWATMLLLNDAFVWEGEEEDAIGDALNDFSIGGLDLYERNRRTE